MSNELASLCPPEGSRKTKKKVGRGPGSGLGKTCGRGEKGQTSRSGKAKGIRVGFEGGQMPLQRRLPKRGFINPTRKEKSVVNLRDLEKFETGAVVGPDDFLARRMVATVKNGVKVLAAGDLTHPVTVKAHACSLAAKKKIEAAGGTFVLIGAGSAGTDEATSSLDRE